MIITPIERTPDNIPGDGVFVWTGTNFNGQIFNILSNSFLGNSPTARVGQLNAIGSAWIQGSEEDVFVARRVYGISSVLEVPGQVVSTPEPSTIIGLGVLATLGIGADFKRKLAKIKKK